jgi:16S rRNA U1498 N3-methylase RsmE
MTSLILCMTNVQSEHMRRVAHTVASTTQNCVRCALILPSVAALPSSPLLRSSYFKLDAQASLQLSTSTLKRGASRPKSDKLSVPSTINESIPSASSSSPPIKLGGPRVLLDDASSADGATWSRDVTSLPIGSRVGIGRQDSHHMLNVRRLRQGSSLIVVANGRSYQCNIVDIIKRPSSSISASTPSSLKKRRPTDMMPNDATWQQVTAEVSSIVDNVTVDRDARLLNETKNVQITIVQGISRGDRMPQVIQHCTELGVVQFVPVMTTRSLQLDGIPHSTSLALTIDDSSTTNAPVSSSHDSESDDDRSGSSGSKGRVDKIRQRWQRIAREATKQCRRTRVPMVQPIVRWNDVIKSIASSNFDIVLLPWEDIATDDSKSSLTLNHVLRQWCTANDRPLYGVAAVATSSGASTKRKLKASAKSSGSSPVRIAVLIGSEGGFTHEEVEHAIATCNAQAITLGSRILRTETAAIASTSAILHAFDEL